jgi:hypothetical protein
MDTIDIVFDADAVQSLHRVVCAGRLHRLPLEARPVLKRAGRDQGAAADTTASSG